jgi:hypothetical protein
VRLTPERVPPSVRLPLEVTVPLRVIPFTVPVPPTLVTVPPPEAAALETQTPPILVRTLPAVPGDKKLILGVDPPLEITGELAETLVTPPVALTEALLTQTPPMLVRTFPAVPGETAAIEPVPLPSRTLLAGRVTRPVPPLDTGRADPRAVTFPLVMVTLESVSPLIDVAVLPSKTDVVPSVIGVLKLLSNLARAMFPLRLAKANGTAIRTSLLIHVQTQKYSRYTQHCYC